jgi:hypothetical protein
MSDPDMPPIFEEAGLEGRPQSAEHIRSTEV